MIDQAAVSWVRSPLGRDQAQDLGSGFEIPAGPYFGVAPAEGRDGAATLPPSTFRLVGNIAPTELEIANAQGLVVGRVTPNSDGSWPRDQMSLGTIDPVRVSVRGVLSDGRSSPLVPLENGWFVSTSATEGIGTPSLQATDGRPAEPPSIGVDLRADPLGAPDGQAALSIGDPTWELVGQPIARENHALAYDPQRRRVVMFGGRQSVQQSTLFDTWEWNGRVWSLRSDDGEGLSSRGGHGMATDPDRGRIVIFGGAFNRVVDGVQFFERLSDTWEWDGSEWTQVPTTTSPSPRNDPAMSYDPGRGRIILFGGDDGESRDDTWQWDGRGWERLELEPHPSPRFSATMTYDAEQERMVLYGGRRGSELLSDVWSLGADGWRLDSETTPLGARQDAAMVYDPVGRRIVLFGGRSLEQSEPLADTWQRTQVGWKQLGPSASPDGRRSHALVFDAARGELVLFGGLAARARRADTWTLSGENWVFQNPGSTPPGRSQHAMVFDEARSQVMIFGGFDSDSTALQDSWVWNGRGWFEVPVTDGPNPGTSKMVYDVARRRVVLHRASSATTWEWDGSDWTLSQPLIRPSQRTLPGMAHDRERQRTVLFGGETSSGTLFDTWEWDGELWTERTAPSGPDAREGSAMVYDSNRGVVVLFGGSPNSTGSRAFSDTWEWNGTDWRGTSPSQAPPQRTLHAMVFDSARRRAVVFGGLDGSDELNDTWEWDGRSWTPQSSPEDLPAVTTPGMAYDSARNETVLFGGFDGTERLDQTWLRSSRVSSTAEYRSLTLPFESSRIQAGVASFFCARAFDGPGRTVLELWTGSAWAELASHSTVGATHPSQTLLQSPIDVESVRSGLTSGRVVLRCRAESDDTVPVLVDHAELWLRYRAGP